MTTSSSPGWFDGELISVRQTRRIFPDRESRGRPSRGPTRARPSEAWHAPAWAGGSGRRSEDDMITLYGFGRIFPEGRGETKDLPAQWALEETGLPYRV